MRGLDGTKTHLITERVHRHSKRSRQSKVSELELSSFGEEEILGFEISVKDSVVVAEGDSLRARKQNRRDRTSALWRGKEKKGNEERERRRVGVFGRTLRSWYMNDLTVLRSRAPRSPWVSMYFFRSWSQN